MRRGTVARSPGFHGPCPLARGLTTVPEWSGPSDPSSGSRTGSSCPRTAPGPNAGNTGCSGGSASSDSGSSSAVATRVASSASSVRRAAVASPSRPSPAPTTPNVPDWVPRSRPDSTPGPLTARSPVPWTVHLPPSPGCRPSSAATRCCSRPAPWSDSTGSGSRSRRITSRASCPVNATPWAWPPPSARSPGSSTPSTPPRIAAAAACAASPRADRGPFPGQARSRARSRVC